MSDRESKKNDSPNTMLDMLNIALPIGTSGINVIKPRTDKSLKDRLEDDITKEEE
jgi:hypothetical protein